METGYLLAFTTGLFGGVGHCIGMCGPIVAAYTLHAAGRRVRSLPVSEHLLYNAGRITTYAFVGSLMGLAGSFVNVAGRFAGFQDIVAVITGFLMIAMGLSISGFLRGTDFIERRNSLILRAIRAVLENDSPWRYYPIGILLGFLPCGLSYSVFIGAAGTGNMLSGMFFALSFGAGTTPALLLFGFMMTWISSGIRGFIYRISGIIVIATGIYFVFKGIGSYAHL